MALDTMGRPIVGRAPRSAPDPTPCRQLRELLERRRRRGLPWDDRAFISLVRLVTVHLEWRTRCEWMTAFTEQRPIWRAAYERTLVVRVRLELD
jgi:hypothetical protein